MQGRRVVVTGLGLVTPLGLSVKDTWRAILAGQSGASSITQFDVSEYPVQFSASVKGFEPKDYVDVKELRKMDTFIVYGLAAADEALADAGLDESVDKERVGVAIGSGIGGLPLIEKTRDILHAQGPKRISPFFIPGAIINMVSGQVSIRHGLKGPNIAVVTACTTGAHNIGYAARSIAYGDADVMVTGGTEMATSPLGVSGFAAVRALSRRNHDPKGASRPFDAGRDGFVLGDGAGVMVLESLDHAKARGANIYAELVGFGQSADASHMTLPDPQGDGGARAMKSALSDAKLSVADVDYINAHATSTPAGDELELLAIQRAFGENAQKLKISSTKSMTGHLLGAAGAIEAIFSVLAIRDGVAPPTINLVDPPSAFDLNLVPLVAQPGNIDVALSNSFGFGGTNASLIFQKEGFR